MSPNYEEYARLEDPQFQSTEVSHLLEQVLGTSVFSRANQLKRATQAWNEANGDRERAHTKAVFLAPPRAHGCTPRLVVYVDSNVLLADFKTNTELYLARLANWGFEVSHIDFRLSRAAGRASAETEFFRENKSVYSDKSASKPTSSELAYVEEATSEVPPELKEQVQQAMLAFLIKNRT